MGRCVLPELFDDWDGAAVTEETVAPPSPSATSFSHTIRDLTNETNYAVRVIAVNDQGRSQPSNEHFRRPQEKHLNITGNSFDGDIVTMQYQRNLDTSTVPNANRVRVMVNGGMRDFELVSISERNVMLTLQSAVSAAENVLVRYFAPSELGGNGFTDAGLNILIVYVFGLSWASIPGSRRQSHIPPTTQYPGYDKVAANGNNRH